MPIVTDIDALLKDAMRARDLRTADVLRMLKTRITERRTSPGFAGEMTDAVVVEVVGAYVKQLEKAIVEYQQAGERGAEAVASLRFEADYCRRFLPQKLGADETRALVLAAIAELGAALPKDAGRVVGHVVKAQRDRVDTTLVKRLAEEALASK
jgi:hypothetical protein